jgi:hypothetical protein
MDELPPPVGHESALLRTDDESAVEIYRDAHPEWTQRVTAEQFLAAHPTLAGRLQPARSPAEWWPRLALPLGVAALIAALLLARDWKIAHLFFEPAPGQDPARTLRIPSLAQSTPPAASAAFVRAIDAAQGAAPPNWTVVLEKVAALRAQGAAMTAVRAHPQTYAWLHEVEAMAHIHLAERQPHRTGHWEAVGRLERDFGPANVARPFALSFAACVARFELAGGSRDLFIGQPSAGPPGELLDAVAALRSRFPAELAKSPAQQRQLARIEGYTLLRRIAPPRVRWASYDPFDASDPANRETWTQLAAAMARWKKLEGERPSADLDQLERVFWQAIERFCKWPTRWKDAAVTIGNHDYRRADAEAALAAIEARRHAK